MLDPHEGLKSAGQHARHARRTGMRLVFSGIGFSAAYFLDPQHGASRRKQAVDFIRRGKNAIARARLGDDEPAFGGADSLVPDPQANGSRVAADGLRIAR
jgi:hypothetical protein